MIKESTLRKLYFEDKLSVNEIATSLSCSMNKVVYWMDKYELKRRTISEAIYQKHNPNGNPFMVKPIKTRADARLQGIGIGLYWGEGTKSNQYSIRLGNTDPVLLNTFMDFLIIRYGVKREDFHFGLQIFTDIDPNEALEYWTHELGVKSSQFYKIIVTISGSLGTYRQKSKYGVLTVHYHNKKLRDIIVRLLPR
jgi:hypothetical protein